MKALASCLRVALRGGAVMSVFAATAASAADADLANGRQVFNRWCAACHADGDAFPGTTSLRVKYKGALPAALEQRTDLNDATVRHFVRNGILMMPTFRKTEISDRELADLATYLSKPKN